MPIITSREHPVIKQLIKLEKSARSRKKYSLTLLDGPHLIQTYYAIFGAPTSLIINQSRTDHDEIKQLLELIARQKKTKIHHVSDTLFRNVSPVKTPTGILATIPIPTATATATTAPINQNNAFYVLLEAIQDPGNLGSILRSAAAANASNIFLSSNCADTWSPKTLRAAMGAHFYLTIHEHCNLIEIIQQFNGKVITTSLRAEKNLYQTSLTGPLAFIIGNEGHGVTEVISQAAGEIITIPMPGKTESLNAAAAAAICFFEKVRQESLTHA